MGVQSSMAQEFSWYFPCHFPSYPSSTDLVLGFSTCGLVLASSYSTVTALPSMSQEMLETPSTCQHFFLKSSEKKAGADNISRPILLQDSLNRPGTSRTGHADTCHHFSPMNLGRHLQMTQAAKYRDHWPSNFTVFAMRLQAAPFLRAHRSGLSPKLPFCC